MNVERRVMEIVDSMKSCSKAAYHKSELLPELFALQQELVSLTFNEDHAELGSLKIWDVERHLEQLNEDCGGAATEELQKFEAGCKVICNLIRAEISGNRGEYKTFCSLENLRTPHVILKNIELTDGEERTEVDALVITCKGAFIIEVKNSTKNIFIDDDGNYYRTGEYQRLDCHIKSKMETRERLLRDALRCTPYEQIPMQSIVVFTNNRIEVRNRCPEVKSCFLGQLKYLIDEFAGPAVFKTDELDTIAAEVDRARCTEAYPMEMDMAQFKIDFATVMAKLEAASAVETEKATVEDIEPVIKEINRESVTQTEKAEPGRQPINLLLALLGSRYIRPAAAGTTAAALAISFASTAFALRHTI